MITITVNETDHNLELDDAIKLWNVLGSILKQHECPCCGKPSPLIRRIPTRYLPWIQITRYLVSPFSPTIACDLCISLAATRKRKKEDRDYLESTGHIQKNYDPSIFDHKRDNMIGYVYVCQHNEHLIKIGKSENVPNRLLQQGYIREQFLFAIKTKAPYQLEKYLHNRFRDKRTSDKRVTEVFDLNEYDLRFILNIKTFRDFKIELITSIDDF